MSRDIASQLGCIYWQDFFMNGKGNPWRVRPTEKMYQSFEIIQLYKVESFSVLFDKTYIDAWKKHYQSLVDVIMFSEKEGQNEFEDLFCEFEAKINLQALDPNSDYQDLYIQFKEFIQNDRSST